MFVVALYLHFGNVFAFWLHFPLNLQYFCILLHFPLHLHLCLHLFLHVSAFVAHFPTFCLHFQSQPPGLGLGLGPGPGHGALYAHYQLSRESQFFRILDHITPDVSLGSRPPLLDDIGLGVGTLDAGLAYSGCGAFLCKP